MFAAKPTATSQRSKACEDFSLNQLRPRFFDKLSLATGRDLYNLSGGY
jgi:hypothetical protein